MVSFWVMVDIMWEFYIGVHEIFDFEIWGAQILFSLKITAFD